VGIAAPRRPQRGSNMAWRGRVHIRRERKSRGLGGKRSGRGSPPAEGGGVFEVRGDVPERLEDLCEARRGPATASVGTAAGGKDPCWRNGQ